MATDPDDILAFWFEEAGPRLWFAGDPAFDARVRRRFGKLLFAWHDGLRAPGAAERHPWIEAPRSALALVIALDQFPRQVWRGSPRAYALDPAAREAARAAIAAGFDWPLTNRERPFLYMPLMHSEDLADQERSVVLCEERLGPDHDVSRHARAHRDVIARFGRFPHRNAVLGRESTAEEAAHLAGGGYAPGVRRRARDGA